jgi:hypothetical protein
MIDPEWRLRGVAPALMDSLRAATGLVIGLGISKDAHRAFVRAGWVDLGRVPSFVRLLRPLQTGRPPVGSWSPGPWVARLSRAGAPLLAGYDGIARCAARAAGCRLEPVAAFDARSDALWQEMSGHWPVTARRDHLWLAWRFDAAPQADAYSRYYLYRGQALIGHAVLRRDGDAVRIVDYLCAPAWLSALFALCLTEARRQGAAVVACLALPRVTRKTLIALGFLRRGGPRLMVLPQDPALPTAALTRPENWHITEADGDLDHWLAPASDSSPL